MTVKDLSYYAKKFTKLHVNRSKQRGNAPHKPILLLSVLELVSQGKIHQNEIYLSPELISAFLKYWSNLVASDHKATIALPFYHLIGDQFWHLQPNPGFEAVKIKPSVSALQQVYAYAYFDAELFSLLQQEASRTELFQLLIKTWFHSSEAEIQNLYAVDAFEAQQLKLFDSGGGVYSIEQIEQETEEQKIVRSATFRSGIILVYEHRCAICHLKIIGSNNQYIVDGAHIKPFSKFHDDRLKNGISLCKNHHWAFDRGWFSITDTYQIIVPEDRIHEEPPSGAPALQDYHGEPILLPNQPQFHPDLEALDWHREFWAIR